MTSSEAVLLVLTFRMDIFHKGYFLYHFQGHLHGSGLCLIADGCPHPVQIVHGKTTGGTVGLDEKQTGHIGDMEDTGQPAVESSALQYLGPIDLLHGHKSTESGTIFSVQVDAQNLPVAETGIPVNFS